MSITKLIAELDSAADNLAVIGNHGVDVVNHQAICMQVAKRLNDLEKSLEGMVLVPRELINDIDNLTEAGFDAAEQIDELCGLLSIAEESK